ncbi:MAG: GH25 family lysozyme [Eubacteriales bacterium]|nr:GH25 family lysozyme [Eubacteriales bacterium]
MKKWKKWLAAGLLTALMGAQAVSASVYNPIGGFYDRRQTVAQEERMQDSDESPLFRAQKVNPNAWKKIDGVCYNGSGVEIPGAITRGIDVSEFQGKINWQKVKNSNVDFAFVRIAYGTGYMDKTYDYNMEQAEAAGVPVGTYVYSTATTTTMAHNEAKLAIEKMKGYKVSYPVVYDLEYAKMGQLSPTKVSQLALAFCNEVRKAGYYPMVYCNTYWYSNHIDWSLLSGLDVWIAQYGDKIQAPSNASYNYTIWQATDGDGGGTLNSTKGLIDGIPTSNDVDIDFGYFDYTKKITPRWQPVSTYSPSSKPDINSGAAVNPGKNGWAEEDGKTYYYVNDQKATGWKKINGKNYYFNSKSGALYKNALLTSSKLNICYVDEEGARVSNQWVDWKDKRYYMGANGYAVKGFNKISGKYYYFHAQNGYMYKNRKIISKAGNIYYLGSDGVRYSNGFYQIKENGKTNTYYFAANGRAYKGWHTINGKKYYFYKGNKQGSGVRAENITLTSSAGVVSVFNKNGVCTKQYKK